MKHRLLTFSALFLLGTLLLASCSFVLGPSLGDDTVEKEVSLLDLTSVAEGGAMEDASKKTMNLRGLQNADEVFYVSLRDYDSLLSAHYVDNVRSKFSDSDNTWQVYVGDTYIFYAQLSASGLTYGGSLYSAMKGEAQRVQTSTLYYQAKNDSEVVRADDNRVVTSFSGLRYYRPMSRNCSIYVPLGILDNQFHNDTSLAHLYGYGLGLLQYDSRDIFSKTVTVKAEETSVGGLIAVAAKEAGKTTMPQSLVQYDYDVLTYGFMNNYGLSSTLGIASMEDYWSAYDLKDALVEKDQGRRMRNLFDFFARLDDGHTALLNLLPWWDETSEGYSRGKFGDVSRGIRTSLQKSRQEHRESKKLGIYDLEISDSGETAMVSLDSFSFAYDAYDGANIKEGLNVHEQDSYLYLCRMFQEAADKGVKQVVIDDSVNGGGSVGVLLKLLALISKNNQGEIGYFNSRNSAARILSASIDKTSANAYPYGPSGYVSRDYDFYILTSPYSFSCANAFPFFARRAGSAKIIGQNSGGGECTVEVATLPSGRNYAHSTHTHIVSIDKNAMTYVGVERGAGVDISLNYADFYNLTAIEKAIQEYKEAQSTEN